MLKYNGLRKRPTYEELIDYLHNRQETIRYPHRIRFSPYALLEDMDRDAIRRRKNMNISITKNYLIKLHKQIYKENINPFKLIHTCLTKVFK